MPDSTRPCPPDCRILLLAPYALPGLPALPWVEDEIQQLVNAGLSLHLERDASERRLVELLGSQPAWDVVWFASHGDAEGVLLSDGLCPVDALAALLRASGVGYVVLNTCASVAVAAAIQEESGADVICTLTAIGDREAWRTAALFARQLARGHDVRRAFELAKPAKPGRYIYLAGDRDLRQRDQLSTIVDQLHTIEGRLERVEQAVTPCRPHPQRRLAIGLAAALVLLDRALLVDELRAALGLEGALAAAGGVLVLALALLLLYLTRPL
jgi:hypothetical protein